MKLNQLKWRGVLFVMSTLLATMPAKAQVLTPDLPQNRPLVLVEEQYKQGHYAMAAQSAKAYLNQETYKVASKNTADINKAKYLLALSYVKGNMPGGADSALKLMRETTDAAYYQRVSFALAQYYFQHDDLRGAIPLYESAGIANLTNDEIADSKFELAYCYFNNSQFDKAAPLFASIKELKNGKYYMAGNYYYGLLSYNDNKYREALNSFNIVKGAKEYRTIVPYYIAEIYYFMGDRKKALAQVDTILKAPEKSFYDNEVHLLAAQSLFEDQHYAEAKPYFEYYYEHADKIRKEDVYEMAYTYYKLNEWPNAIDKFKMLNEAQDSLGQTAMYLLGDCYLRTGDKSSARNAFDICSEMSFNKGQQEASMILYSRLSYEMGYNDDALRSLNALLDTYPKTRYKDEANTIISDLLIKTNDYEGALKHLDEVSVKDNEYHSVYQKAAFGYAVQYYRSGDLTEADKYFSQTLQHPGNTAYESGAYFWKGEIAYKTHRYNDVITSSQQFVNRKSNARAVARVSPLATLQHAYINMGYAAMEMQNFGAAQNYFADAQETGDQDNYSAAIAALREADAVFLQKNYAKAITLYDKIINANGADPDYARYQKGILLGLQGKDADKIALLQTLVKSTPPSQYANNARYEIAITYMDDDKWPQALSYLRALTDTITDKSFAPSAWMKTGFVYQQTKEPAKAIEAYKHVVIDYPASGERMAALDALRSLYIESNQPAAYTKMLRDNNLPSADSSSIDSTYYAAAEGQFAAGKWESATQAFTNYLQQYPNGIFAVKAHYYRAEGNFQLKKYKEAHQDYVLVMQGPSNDFTENSARRAAAIAYEQKDYAAAYNDYLKLKNNTAGNKAALAYKGLIRSGFYSGKYAEASAYADSLLAMPGLSAEDSSDAMYFKAKSLQQFDKKEEALVLYEQLSRNKNNDAAAEARYRIAEIYLQQNKLTESENAANEAIKLAGGNDYWIIKSFMLLADISIKQKDYFNAKATLQSIVKRAKIQELKTEASKKLEEVKKLEKQKSKLSGQ